MQSGIAYAEGQDPVAQGTTVVAFLDEDRGFTTACPAPMQRSVDGGRSWSPGYARELCRYGMEAVPGLIVNVGWGGDIRRSRDVGVRYERAGSFGLPYPHHARHLSFLDERRGLVAAVTLADEQGRLVIRFLDESGDLWRSDDGGRGPPRRPRSPSPCSRR